MSRGAAQLFRSIERAAWLADLPREAGGFAIALAIGAFLRLFALDYGQFRNDDVTLWNIVREFVNRPTLLASGMHSSFGVPNGPFQAYLLAPGVLARQDPLGAYVTVALLNVGAIALLWAFVRSYWGPKVALVAAVLYAVNPWAVIFSRRLWGNDLVAPFTILLIWSLSDLARFGRKRDAFLPFVWLAIVVQVYVVALVHVPLTILGLILARRQLHWPSLVAGAAVFSIATAPYLVGSVLPTIGHFGQLLGASTSEAVVDLASVYFLFHVVSSEGYQAFANQAGGIVDATRGLPWVASVATEVLLAGGITVAMVSAARELRRGDARSASPYVLPLVAVSLPALLLIRHTTPVYPYYLVTGMPMHFLFVALGVRLLWRALQRIPTIKRQQVRLASGAVIGVIGAFIVGTHLLLAQVFFTAIRGYWPQSDYGLPMHYTFDLGATVQRLAEERNATRVYLGGGDERDSVLFRAMRVDVPSLVLFDSTDSFVWPRTDVGNVLYVLSSSTDRVGSAFAQHLAQHEVGTFQVPGAGLRYTFYDVPAGMLGDLFTEAAGTPVGVTFDDRVRLESYVTGSSLQPGAPNELILRWQLLESTSPTLPSYFVFVRLVDPLHQVYHGEDWPLYDTTQWQQGDQILWWRLLPTPVNLAPGIYSYLIGLTTVTSSTSYQNARIADANGTPIAGDGIQIGRLVAKSGATADPEFPIAAAIAEQVALQGYDLDVAPCGPERTLDLALYWQAIAPPDRDYTVFVHLLGPDGAILTQDDAPPEAGRFPTSVWPPGEIVVDHHQLRLPADLAAGDYRIATGLYDASTGERLGGASFAITFAVTVPPCKG